MLELLKNIVRRTGFDTRQIYHSVSARSLDAAAREQGLTRIREILRSTVPDLRDQYTGTIDPEEYSRYWEIKMRSIHAFQVDCALQAMDMIGGRGLTVVDVGDSSGNHGIYLQSMAPAGQLEKFVSVNLDPVAVEKVRAKGGEAILCRAEALADKGLAPDLVLLLETLEHISDPLRFLRSMAHEGNIPNILLTVPFRRQSRFGGELIRRPLTELPAEITPEVVHIFELCPDDWQLLARLAGYRTVFRKIYRQYPQRSFYRLMKPVWRQYDFEGFLALFLERDDTLSDRYTGW